MGQWAPQIACREVMPQHARQRDAEMEVRTSTMEKPVPLVRARGRRRTVPSTADTRATPRRTLAGMRAQPTDTWPSKRTRWRSVIEQSRNYDNGSAARLCDNGILVARRHHSVSPSLEILSQWIPGSPR